MFKKVLDTVKNTDKGALVKKGLITLGVTAGGILIAAMIKHGSNLLIEEEIERLADEETEDAA